MKDFILKKSNLVLLVTSSLILLTLIFNYLYQGGSSSDETMIRGYEALFGTTIIDGIMTIKVKFNLILVLVLFVPFILSLIALIYEKKINKDVYFRIIYHLALLVAFLLAFIVLSKIDFYLTGTFNLGSGPRNMAFTSFDLSVFAQVASYLAALGTLLMFVRIVIDYGDTHS
jgi:glucan phosphoethanolaminetransferase (alkaline phosphatase superfamily)